MEWMNRGASQAQQSNQQTQQPTVIPAANQAKEPKKPKGKWLNNLKVIHVAFLFLATILVISVIVGLGLGGNKNSESRYVDSSKLQAVFLNGGQVYFGNIQDLNSEFLTMGNIYYLRVNQQVQPNQQQSNNSNDISLVKLGCELHGPTDSMVINREQVVFWENLKNDGQVAKAVEEYKKSNKGEQKCETSTQSPAGTGTNIPQNDSSQPTSTTTPSAPTTTNPTTPSTTKPASTNNRR